MILFSHSLSIYMFSKIKAIKDLRDQAKQMQNAMEGISASGSGAWGKVKVQVNGNMQTTSVEVDDALLSDKAALQKAFMEAMNDAMKNIQKELAAKMKDMGGLDKLKELMG